MSGEKAHPEKNAQSTAITKAPVRHEAKAVSEVVRFTLLGAQVATAAIIPECIADQVNKKALDQSMGNPVTSAAANGANLKGKGITSLFIKSVLRVFAPLPAKMAASSNKNGVRRGTELVKESNESTAQDKILLSNEEQPAALPPMTGDVSLATNAVLGAAINKQAQVSVAADGFSLWNNVKYGSIIVQFGLAEAFITGRRTLSASHQTEKANFNHDFQVPAAPTGFRTVDDWKARLRYRTLGTTVRTIRNSSQIFMFPVCSFLNDKMKDQGVSKLNASFASSAVTGIIFSPALTIMGLVYRGQAITANTENAFRGLSMAESARQLPADFIKKAFWGKPAICNAGLSVMMLLIVNGVEKKIDSSVMPYVTRGLHHTGIYLKQNYPSMHAVLFKEVRAKTKYQGQSPKLSSEEKPQMITSDRKPKLG